MNNNFKKRELIKNFFYENQNLIYSSIAKIENFNISIGETDQIINSFIKNENNFLVDVPIRSFFMIIGIYKAYKNYFLSINMINDEFDFDFDDLLKINQIIGNYEDDRCGNIRTHKVFLNGINSYIPPDKHSYEITKNEFQSIKQKFLELKSKNNENELIDFIFNTGANLLKEQWFPNSNNRTISLFMNLMLENAALGFYFVNDINVNEYKQKRNNFYENDENKKEFVEFMKNKCFLNVHQIELWNDNLIDEQEHNKNDDENESNSFTPSR